MSEVISLLVIMSIWTNSFVLLTSYVLDKLNYSMGLFRDKPIPVWHKAETTGVSKN